jgi:diadenosine tetraphosphate (Ap4A) HIT family hydrolase
MATPECPFCDLDGLRAGAAIYLENRLCVFANSETLEGDLLRGSGVMVPRSHRPTVFDLSPEEVAATFELLSEARRQLDRRYRPDGFNIGWNCYAAGGQAADHAHMHVLLRFADEPRAGEGIRWPLRQPDNRRPDPSARGSGRRDFLSA